MKAAGQACHLCPPRPSGLHIRADECTAIARDSLVGARLQGAPGTTRKSARGRRGWERHPRGGTPNLAGSPAAIGAAVRHESRGVNEGSQSGAQALTSEDRPPGGVQRIEADQQRRPNQFLQRDRPDLPRGNVGRRHAMRTVPTVPKATAKPLRSRAYNRDSRQIEGSGSRLCCGACTSFPRSCRPPQVIPPDRTPPHTHHPSRGLLRKSGQSVALPPH